MVCIAGQSRAAVLAALLNAKSKIRIGDTVPDPDVVDEDEARIMIIKKIVTESDPHQYFFFDWLKEKRIKVDLTNESAFAASLREYHYDKDFSIFKLAIEILRATCNPCHPDIVALQKRG